MRDDLDSRLTLEQRDLACDGEAAASREIRLEHIDVAELDKRAKRGQRRVGLARGDPRACRIGEATIAVEIVGESASSNQYSSYASTRRRSSSARLTVYARPPSSIRLRSGPSVSRAARTSASSWARSRPSGPQPSLSAV